MIGLLIVSGTITGFIVGYKVGVAVNRRQTYRKVMELLDVAKPS